MRPSQRALAARSSQAPPTATASAISSGASSASSWLDWSPEVSSWATAATATATTALRSTRPAREVSRRVSAEASARDSGSRITSRAAIAEATRAETTTAASASQATPSTATGMPGVSHSPATRWASSTAEPSASGVATATTTNGSPTAKPKHLAARVPAQLGECDVGPAQRGTGGDQREQQQQRQHDQRRQRGDHHPLQQRPLGADLVEEGGQVELRHLAAGAQLEQPVLEPQGQRLDPVEAVEVDGAGVERPVDPAPEGLRVHRRRSRPAARGSPAAPPSPLAGGGTRFSSPVNRDRSNHAGESGSATRVGADDLEGLLARAAPLSTIEIWSASVDAPQVGGR